MKRFSAAVALAVLLVLSLAVAAGAKTGGAGSSGASVPPINYGVADDGGKYSDTPATFFTALKGGGLTEDRWTLNMDQNNPTAITELPFLQRAAPLAQAAGVHVVLALYATTVKDASGNVIHSSSQSDPTAFCTWAALVAKTVSVWGVHDYIVWNEPNTALYWAPQDANAPSVYEALLAKCYDTIHAADPAAHVIGFGLSPRSNGPSQTAPLDFLKAVGAAYKASGRTAPLMDQLSIHPYPNSSTDSPDVGYKSPSAYGIPNLDRVKQSVYDAFNGTGQPTTLTGLTFRIDELGWQSDTSGYSTPYYHAENVAVVSEQQQADYIQQSVQKYFACDPTVTDVEFFLLQDEASRDGKDLTGATIGGGWQSGFMTPDGKPKKSYTQDAPFLTQGRNACTGSQVTWTPAGGSNSGGGTSSKPGKGGPTTTPTTTPGQGGGPCPRGANNATLSYCAKLVAQVAQIRKSALQIEASYNSVAASATKILTKVKSPTIIKQVNAKLQEAAALDAKTKSLLTLATPETDVYTQRDDVALARTDIAIARINAAEARTIAAIAVATGG